MNPITKLQLCFAALSRRVNNLDPGDLYLRPSAGDVTVSSDMDSFLSTANDAAARTALGLGTGDSPTFTNINLSNSLLLQSEAGPQGLNFNHGGIYGVSIWGGADARVALKPDGYFAWCPGSLDGSADLRLYRGAANTLYQRNGTAAQTFLLANTWTDDSNYERGSIGWNSNFLQIGTENAGTGSPRGVILGGYNLYLRGNGLGGSGWVITTDNHLLAGTDNTYDIGASGANRPRDLFLARNLTLTGLPTSDPGVTGRIWNDAGTLKISP